MSSAFFAINAFVLKQTFQCLLFFASTRPPVAVEPGKERQTGQDQAVHEKFIIVTTFIQTDHIMTRMITTTNTVTET